MHHEREMPLPAELSEILRGLPDSAIVGGAVRDWLLGETPKDLDVEVYRTSPDDLRRHLSKFGRVDEVGKAFGVIKVTINKTTYDFALPRRDSKSGRGHKGFSVEHDPNMTPAEAAGRRDITINSMAWKPSTKELLDPFGGRDDLRAKTIRHTSPQFPEDPLRPLRCFQFAARFSMRIAKETADLCRSMAAAGAFSSLPKERIGEEFLKFLLKGKDHNSGLNALHEMGWSHHFPEIHALFGLEQEPAHHPEGDVATHTGHCLDALHQTEIWRTGTNELKTRLAYAVLCHDLGKASTTCRRWKENLGREAVTSYGHDTAGAEPTMTLAEKAGIPRSVAGPASLLVIHHMTHLWTKTDREILKLAMALSPANPHAENARVTTTIRELAAVVESDHSGRPPLDKGLPEKMGVILRAAERLGCLDGPQKTLLNGKRLQTEPLPTGQAVGVILKTAYEAQISGEFSTGETALAWVKKHKKKILTESGLGPKPLINGKDLMAAGLPPGPHLTALCAKAYDLQLLGKISTKEEALAQTAGPLQQLG